MTQERIYRTAWALLLWFLAAFFIDSNFAATELMVELSTDIADVARVYFSADSQWDFSRSSGAVVNPGWNRIVFRLPLLETGAVVRLDPGSHATTYRIHAVNWLRGGLPHPVRLDALVNARADINRAVATADALEFSAQGNAAQLIVPAPGLAWQIGSLLLPIGLPLLGLAVVCLGLRRNTDPLRMAAVALATCAGFYIAYYLLNQSRLPHYDDWRYLYPTPYSLIDGGWRWLTLVSNDTYYLTNQLLDYVVLRVSNVSFFWLRATALGVLALQLITQYRLLTRVTVGQPWIGGVAVACGIWSLSSEAYWGTTAVGYQQALPTLFATLCLLCLINRDGSFKPHFSYATTAACCVAAGLAYISGGLLILALGIACFLSAERIASPWRDPAARAGFVLSGLGAALLLLQVALVWHQQGSLLDHNHASAPAVYPNDRRFWLFFFALFGRALGYTGNSVVVDLGCTVLTLSPGVFLSATSLWAALHSRVWQGRQACKLLAIYAAAGAATYAAIVAFGRSGFVAADADVQTIVTTAKARFHFWAIAAMLPFAWLGWGQIGNSLGTPVARRLGAVVAILMLLPKSEAVFDQTDYLRIVDTMSRTGAHCVVAQLSNLDTNQPIVCGIMTGEARDLSPTLRKLRARQAAMYHAMMEEGGFKE